MAACAPTPPAGVCPLRDEGAARSWAEQLIAGEQNRHTHPENRLAKESLRYGEIKRFPEGHIVRFTTRNEQGAPMDIDVQVITTDGRCDFDISIRPTSTDAAGRAS